MWLHGQQPRLAVDACLLEEAAAPADACDGRRVAGSRRDAVRGERQVRDRRRRARAPRSRATSRSRRRPRATSAPRARRAPARSRQARSSRTPRLGVVDRLDAGHGKRLAGREGMERLAERARECERLLRQVAGLLDVDERCHHATPIRCSTSTTAGAASGPWPRISASLPCPSGTTRRSFSRRGSGLSGELASTGLRWARSFAGTDG